MTDLPVDPDAQATVSDFLDYTEYLPSDLSRSLTLIRNLDERYLSSVTNVHNLAVAYSQIPNVPLDNRNNPQYLRENISTNLDYAIRSRESSYAEAKRVSEVIDRYFNRLTSIISKLTSLPKPPSRDPTPVPQQSLASSRRNKSGSKDDGRYRKTPLKKGLDGTPHPRIRLRLEGPRATGSSGRVTDPAPRPRHRTQKVTVPGEVLPPRNPDSPSSDTDSEWEFRPPSPVPMATSRVGVPSRNRLIKTTPKPLKTPKTPRIRISKELKTPHTPSHKSPNESRSPGTLGTNVHSSIAGISTTNAISLLQPPPPDAKPGSEHAPWLSLTEWEMAKLRKRMKKNAVWVPSSTRIRRELTEAGRGPENYRIQKARAEASGEEFIDEAHIATTIRVRPLAQGEISAGPLGPEEMRLTNKGTQLNEAKKLKRERLAREAAAEAAAQAEQAAKKLGDIGNTFKNLFPQTPTKANGNPSQHGTNLNAKRTAKATEARKEKARERKRKLEQLVEQQRLEIQAQRQPKPPEPVTEVTESETVERHVTDVDMLAETQTDPQEHQRSKEDEEQKETPDSERNEPSGEIVFDKIIESETRTEIDNQNGSENESGTESGTDAGDEGDGGKERNALINEQAQEKAKQEELEREQERERQREIALQLERQREIERQRQAEIEMEKQREIERARQREEETKRERERAAQKEMELELERIKKQREREMEIEKEKELAKQKEKAMEIEREKQREIARQKAMEEEREKEREKEREMQRETERQVQREMDIRQEMAQKLLEDQQRQQQLDQMDKEQEQKQKQKQKQEQKQEHLEDVKAEGGDELEEEEGDENEVEEEGIVAAELGEKGKGEEAISTLILTKGKRSISPSPIKTTDPQEEPSPKRRRIIQRREAPSILSTTATTTTIPLAPEASPPPVSIAATPQVKNLKGILRNSTPVTRSRRLSWTLKGPAPQVEPLPSRTRPSPRTSRSTVAAQTPAPNTRELPSRFRPNARAPSRRSSAVDQPPTTLDREHLRRKPSTPAAAPHTVTTTPASRLRKRPEGAAVAASEGRQKSSTRKAGSAAAANARRAGRDAKVKEEEEEYDEENTEEDPDLDPRYCYCNDVSFGMMIWCEHPQCKYNWFHLKCVGITKAPPKEVKWYCDECRAKPGKR